jgi:quercetin dioxygenase-like cupin family protein
MRTAGSTVVLFIACIGAASLPAADATAADSASGKLAVVARHADVAGVVVSSIEGKPMHGTLVLKPMLKGEQMTLLELHYQSGAKAPLHTHSHESIIYVVSGRVRTWVGDDVYDLGPGDVARHPAGVLHTVEALAESTIIEIKSPAPDIATFIRAREQK